MAARKGPQRARPRFDWLRRPPPTRPVSGCQRVPDTTETLIEAQSWVGGEGRDLAASAELRAEGLLRANRGLLGDFGVEADVRRISGTPTISLRTSGRIGALPLLSPVTGRPDFGLIIEPRFSWSGLGDVLSTTGFRVVPRLLPLPELPQSDRRIPAWVLSSVVLARVERLLDRLSRRFETVEADLEAPKGAVNWTRYATERIPFGRALAVPCRFPDLRDDGELLSAAHFVLRQHQGALLGQRHAGVVVLQLLAICERLLQRLQGVPPQRPSGMRLEAWRRQALPTRVFAEGLQAIAWTVEERGLAGLSELAGLSWQLDMDAFFESWVETLADRVAKSAGATLRVGRREETRVNLEWRPPKIGSQRSLLPDVVVARGDAVLVLDAKYKSHAEEIDARGYFNLDAAVRERHRGDLLQALAYSTMFDAPRVVACLVYPCRQDTYESLVARGQVMSRARVTAGSRVVEVALASAPIGGNAEPTVAALGQLLHEAC